jgi:hypothetical protein
MMAGAFRERFRLQGSKAWIEAGFKRDDSQNWRAVVKDTLHAAYDAKHEDALRDAVKEHVLKTVAAEDEK